MNQISSSEYTISRKESKSRKTSNRDDFQRQGRWSAEQNLKYLVFLSFNLSKFQCKKKRMFRLYKPLSKFILTRNSEQCRSHHRKLIQRFKTPKNIVSNLQQQFQKEEIQQLRDKNIERLKELHIPQKKIRNNEKQEFLVEKLEQKKRVQNQNVSIKRSQNIQKKTWIENEDCKEKQFMQFTSNFSACQDIAIINYQALNWLNQMCLTNYNYFYSPNSFDFYNSFALPGGNMENC